LNAEPRGQRFVEAIHAEPVRALGRTGATVSSPWPYAFAFTTAINAFPAPLRPKASILLRSRAESISTHDNMHWIIP
jgi:hypothetical protein